MDATEAETAAVTVEKVAEALVPAIAPFDPLISLITTAIIAHFNATKVWPTADQVTAALPPDYNKFVANWAAWKPSGDGSIK